MGLNDINSLSHTKWKCKCKYHIVFAPKYRRKVFFREQKAAIGKILRQLCEWKGVRIVEAEVCPDHVHMLVEIPPKIAVSSFMGYHPLSFKMTFANADGTVVESLTVKFLDAAAAPEGILLPSGYLFLGRDSEVYQCVTECIRI